MRTLFIVFALLPLAAMPHTFVPAASATPPAPQFASHRVQMSPEEREAERERIRQLNKQRQEKLKQDTDKLLQLATELKQYVDKTNESILSLDVIKKTEEIEKLSRSIRDKMKNAYDIPRDSGFPPE